MKYQVIAGGAYGHRHAIYKLQDDRLVLIDEGDHDNLDGNWRAADFGGYTLPEAEAKIKALNSEGSGHSYDGCHACTWQISIREREG